MPLDLDAIAPKRRNTHILNGRHFGSERTLAQADDTLAALKVHGTDISGFAPRDQERLEELVQALLEAGVQRGAAKTAVTAATAAYATALSGGKQVRREADAVLRGALSDLADAGEEEVVTKIEIALNATSSTGANAEALRGQLATQREVLVLEPVAAATADRGGPDVVTKLDAAVLAMRAAEQTRPGKPGTPKETERLDLIDGMIVDLVRRARRAARAASTALGKPAIAKAFELDALYGRPRKKADPTPPV